MSGLSGAHAFLWQDGKMIDLASLSGGFTETLGINDLGQIVGESQDENRRRAFLWESGNLLDLNQLLPQDSGWFLSEARDINNSGQ
jgi:probable HAF family extracellular repeat protein